MREAKSALRSGISQKFYPECCRDGNSCEQAYSLAIVARPIECNENQCKWGCGSRREMKMIRLHVSGYTKVLTVLFLFAAPAFAQDAAGTAVAPGGCGLDNAKFEVKTEKQHPLGQPQAGKALVYLIEDDTEYGSFPRPTVRAGVDGVWVGATHGDSYFSFTVDPGEHHLCASWQTEVALGHGHPTAAAHLSAEAGVVYFFRVKNKWTRDFGFLGMDFQPLDPDEGQLMASKFSFSTFHPKN
jgi:hypothetical protein